MSSRFALILAVLAVCIAAGIAADRMAVASSARREREAARESLRRAAALLVEHPQVFGPGASSRTGGVSLKTLVEEAARIRNVSLGYLSETQRETDRGPQERQVLIRLLNAVHSNVVFFLQDLETRSCGARIKELHLRPSRVLPDTYEEVEVVVSKGVPKTDGKGP